MCGILGQINARAPIEGRVFDQMRDILAHRGPDGAGSWFSHNHKVALGHRRLAFLDLSAAGQQPMGNERGKLWITLNGEIYNYLELRQELQALGHQFRTQTDTETLLLGYEQWGLEVLRKVKGMFAFGIWDEARQELLLARDRFGIKPLYYGWMEGNFYFASELKAILAGLPARPALRETAISDYLAYRYVPSPGTIWEGFYKLPPASYIILSPENLSAPRESGSYWSLQLASHQAKPAEAAEHVGKLLTASVQEHLRSDVPIGNFLSGGYDSSALLAYSKALGNQPAAFSIGFHGWAQSEHQYAELAAKHLDTPLHTTMVGAEQLELMDVLSYHYDEPIADISTVPTYLVSQLASRYNKAVLSGEGADELFGGYTWQKAIARHGRWQAWAAYGWQKLRAKPGNCFVERYAEAMAMGRFNHHNLSTILHPRLHQTIPPFSEWFYAKHYRPGIPPLKAFQYLDLKTFMAELVLTKIDRASMAHSLEVRVPFLDHELVEYLFQLHPAVYFRQAQSKYLLWENIRQRLPEAILQRPKQGFVGPDSYYMDLNWYRQHLQDGCLIQDAVVSSSSLEELFRQKSHWQLWKLIVLEKWWKRWMR